MRILLAIPTGGNPTVPFLESLRDLRLPEDATAFDRLTIVGNFVPGQREFAARRALNVGADILIMVDDDIVVPPDAFIELLAALAANPRLGVVAALYYSRDGLHPMAASQWNSNDTTTAAIPAFGDELIFCDAVGFGCAAIRVSALSSLPAPFFNVQVYVEEQAARVRICNEDYLFCEEVRRGGWLVALHAGVRCKHYDRVSRVAYPLEWEAPAMTSIKRMMVVDPGPTYRIMPYDSSVPTKPERHASATIDYIIVD